MYATVQLDSWVWVSVLAFMVLLFILYVWEVGVNLRLKRRHMISRENHLYALEIERQKLKDTEEVLQAYRDQLPGIIESKDKLQKAISEFEDEKQSLKDQNEFYEAKIKHLTEQLKDRTCHNRETALKYAVDHGFATEHGFDSDATVKAAKLYHRFLQGKE